MKNKKTIVILASVVAVCLLGVVLSKLINWPVDTTKSSGNIAKTTRFSRKTAEDGASNMQELLLNDEDYKNGILATYVIMKARADQFSSLVNLSSEVAGDIKEFQPVLKDMKKALPTVNNVCSSLQTACEDLNSVFGGETPKSLEQNANNAALAYSTLQKLNNLADSFIKTTDDYLKNSEGSAPLKLIRDQWVSYQQVTAVLSDDSQLAQDLEERGFLLNVEQTRNALNEFTSHDISELSHSLCGAAVAMVNSLDNYLCDVVFTVNNLQDMSSVGTTLQDMSSVEKTLQDMSSVGTTLQDMGSVEKTLQDMSSVGTTLQDMGSVEKTLQDMSSVGTTLQNGVGFQSATQLMSTTLTDFKDLKASFVDGVVVNSANVIPVVSHSFTTVVNEMAQSQSALSSYWEFQ